MRNTLIILAVSISINISAQNRYSPFSGGFEFGIGYSSIIDFNKENNINLNAESRGHLDYRLNPFLPYQFGFVSAKYLDSYKYLEFGLIFNKSSVGWIYLSPRSGWALTGLNFYSIDLPFKYYFPTGNFMKDIDAYMGLIPSWVIKSEAVSNDLYTDIDDDYFRKAYLSLCSGLSRDLKNLRFKIHTALAIISVVKPTYRQQIPAVERSYGEIILPFEILFCCAYIIK